jgi:hypothetical protein
MGWFGGKPEKALATVAQRLLPLKRQQFVKL